MAWSNVSSVPNFSLSSSWKGYNQGSGPYYSTPSTASGTKTFDTSGIPQNSAIHSASLSATLGSPYTGSAVRRVNGTGWSGTYDALGDLQALGGSFAGGASFTFSFRANGGQGSVSSAGSSHSSSLTHSDVTLAVSYTPPHTPPSVSGVKINGSTAYQYAPASSGVTLSWAGTNGSYNAISGYLVYVSVNGGGYTLLASGVTGTSLVVAAPASAGHYHEYYVVAAGEFSNSDAAYSTRLYAYSSLTAPGSVALSAAGAMPGAAVTLSWFGAAAGTGVSIANYSIRRSTSAGGAYTEVATIPSSPLSFTAPAAAGTYYYKVLAYSSVPGYDSGLSAAYAELAVQDPKSTVTLSRSTVPMDGVSQITASIQRANAAFTHSVRWYVDGTNTETHELDSQTTSDTLTVMPKWIGSFPNAREGYAYCELTTRSGGAVIGTETVRFQVTVPHTVLPNVSLVFTPTNPFNGLYLKGVSSVTATAVASGVYNSTITSYSLVGNAKSVDTASMTTGALTTVGINTFTATVEDSRQNRRTVSNTITVTDYSKPVITNVSCKRTLANMSPNNDGTCITVSAEFYASSVPGNAIAASWVKYRRAGSTAWLPSGTEGIALTSDEPKILATGIGLEYGYEVEFTLVDKVGQSTPYYGFVPPSTRLFDLRTTRAALGRLAATDKRFMLPEDWDIEHKGQTLDERFSRSDHTHGYAASNVAGGPANTLLGSYTYSGGQQPPNYFGRNKVGCLMMNTPVNGNGNYKDWLIMDGYNGDDVGGGTAFGVDRQSMRAFIMGSDAARTAWTRSAELVTTANMVNLIYPIGSIYMSTSATNPGSLFGGSWERYALGRVLVGVSEGEGEWYFAGQAGGAKYHTLTANEMPVHSHGQDAHNHGGGTGGQSSNHSHRIGSRVLNDGGMYVVDRQVTSAGYYGTETGAYTDGANADHYHGIPAAQPGIWNNGSGWGHNNMQPYIAVYIWRRIG